MSQYNTLDALIVESIRTNEPGGPLYGTNVCQEASRLEKETGRKAFRVIDARLQALRKAGNIRFVTKAEVKRIGGWDRPGWNVVPQKSDGEQA